MKVTFNIEKLKKLVSDFYNCTNITITLFDSELHPITDAGKWQPYCMNIGEHPHLLDKCNTCNRENALKARGLKSTLLYSCHAGIVESVTPIFMEGTLIAYLMLGKFRDAESVYSSKELVSQAAEKYGLDKNVMLNAYEMLPVLSKDYIDSAISILETCIYYIVDESLIHLHHSALSSKIEQFIDNNLAADITVNELADEFNLPRQILYSIFKLEFNDTIKNFILKKRLEAAQKLLIETDRSISDISNEVGFLDYNYFIRFFKKKTGISPLQYRKTNKGK